jgi:glycosyltransferase involved in cell wall biosynthesis
MRPIRLVNVITRLIVGGAQETALDSCARFDRSRIDPLLITGPQTGSEGELFGEAKARGVEVVIEPSLVRELNPLKDPVSVARLVAQFRRLRPDIVHTHSSKAGIVGRIAARLAHVPHVVHTVHGWGFHPRQRWAERALYQTLERACAPLADALVVVAEPNRAQGLALGIGRPEQYHLIRSGIEIAPYAAAPDERERMRAALGIAPHEFVFGNVGRLSEQKSPLDLVAAFVAVATRRPEARLVLVGDGPLKGDVERMIREAGLGARVHLAGLRRDVPAFLGAFDAFVLSSRWEGLPRVMPQAMAAGLPLIATATDGTPEAVREGETGWLVAPADPAALADRMERLLADPARARAMGARGKECVAEFSAERMVERLETLYRELVEGSRPKEAP